MAGFLLHKLIFRPAMSGVPACKSYQPGWGHYENSLRKDVTWLGKRKIRQVETSFLEFSSFKTQPSKATWSQELTNHKWIRGGPSVVYRRLLPSRPLAPLVI